MKFRNKTTGVTVIVNNDFVLEQMSKSLDYEEVKEVKETKTTKSVKETEKKK